MSCPAAPMKRLPVHAWVRFAVITATVLYAHAGLSGTAAASCGDYISVGGSHTQPSHVMPAAAVTSAPTAPAWAVPPAACRQCPAPGQRPCRGPWCGKSEVPLAPPLAPVERGSDTTWACGWLTSGAIAPDSARFRPVDARSTPTHHTDSIFHPPRP